MVNVTYVYGFLLDDKGVNDLSQLILNMHSNGTLQSPRVARAMKRIDRKDFGGIQNRRVAYEDRPLPIGYDQTISQPSTVAFMLELLNVWPGDKILDVGSGSGWTTALLAQLAGADGRVYGTELVPELVEFGEKNLEKYGFNNASIQPAEEEVGLLEKAPFDRILVSAAAEKIPSTLIEQLALGGRMVIPVNNTIQVITKDHDGDITQQGFGGFVFVPLHMQQSNRKEVLK